MTDSVSFDLAQLLVQERLRAAARQRLAHQAGAGSAARGFSRLASHTLRTRFAFALRDAAVRLDPSLAR